MFVEKPTSPTESFIAPIADLSALGGCDDVRINLLRHGSNELDSS